MNVYFRFDLGVIQTSVIFQLMRFGGSIGGFNGIGGMNVYFRFDLGVIQTSVIFQLMRFGGSIGGFNGIGVKVGVVEVVFTL